MLRKMFVYGTLMDGLRNERFINKKWVEKREKGYTNGTLYMVKNANFPAVIIDNVNCVIGEIVTIKEEFYDDCIKSCDYLESEGFMYVRKVVKVKDMNNEVHEAWIYEFLNKKHLGRQINTGDFRDCFEAVLY